jgi:hypothetical protein
VWGIEAPATAIRTEPTDETAPLLVGLVRHLASGTMRPLPVEIVRAMPGIVLGHRMIRGKPVPVCDARVLVGRTDRPGL